MMIKWW